MAERGRNHPNPARLFLRVLGVFGRPEDVHRNHDIAALLDLGPLDGAVNQGSNRLLILEPLPTQGSHGREDLLLRIARVPYLLLGKLRLESLLLPFQAEEHALGALGDNSHRDGVEEVLDLLVGVGYLSLDFLRLGGFPALPVVDEGGYLLSKGEFIRR